MARKRLIGILLPGISSETETKSEEEFIEAEKQAFGDNKFAALRAAITDVLLDDETSPSDSLISSSASDDAISKTQINKRTFADLINEDDEEKDIDEISPIFDASSPVSHGTPTHASNSFSLSDGDAGRDFLIDDEIADQPDLCFGGKHDGDSKASRMHSTTDTPTLMESMRGLKGAADSVANSYAPQVKPRHSILSRTESLDTLSPCESICSEDMMMDFECNSSIDSIDR